MVRHDPVTPRTRSRTAQDRSFSSPLKKGDTHFSTPNDRSIKLRNLKGERLSTKEDAAEAKMGSPKHRASFFEEYATNVVQSARKRSDTDLQAAVGLLGKVSDLSQELVELRKLQEETEVQRDEAIKDQIKVTKAHAKAKQDASKKAMASVEASETCGREALLWGQVHSWNRLCAVFTMCEPVNSEHLVGQLQHCHFLQQNETTQRKGIELAELAAHMDILQRVNKFKLILDQNHYDHENESRLAGLRANLVETETKLMEAEATIRKLRTQLRQADKAGQHDVIDPLDESDKLTTVPKGETVTYPPKQHKPKDWSRLSGEQQARSLLRAQMTKSLTFQRSHSVGNKRSTPRTYDSVPLLRPTGPRRTPVSTPPAPALSSITTHRTRSSRTALQFSRSRSLVGLSSGTSFKLS